MKKAILAVLAMCLVAAGCALVAASFEPRPPQALTVPHHPPSIVEP